MTGPLKNQLLHFPAALYEGIIKSSIWVINTWIRDLGILPHHPRDLISAILNLSNRSRVRWCGKITRFAGFPIHHVYDYEWLIAVRLASQSFKTNNSIRKLFSDKKLLRMSRSSENSHVRIEPPTRLYNTHRFRHEIHSVFCFCTLSLGSSGSIRRNIYGDPIE